MDNRIEGSEYGGECADAGRGESAASPRQYRNSGNEKIRHQLQAVVVGRLYRLIKLSEFPNCCHRKKQLLGHKALTVDPGATLERLLARGCSATITDFRCPRPLPWIILRAAMGFAL